MIETLNGTRETVHHKADTHVRLYVNDEKEHYPLHWHSDMEIICPLEGDYLAVFQDQTLPLRPGDVLFIASGTLHDLPAREGVRIIFQINWSPLRELHGLETALFWMAPYCLVTPENAPSFHEKVRQCLLQIRDFYLQSPLLTEASIYAKALEMITVISRNRKAIPKGKENPSCARMLQHSETMQKVCDYIVEHCSEGLLLEDAASYAGFSKFHFERLFRDYTDMTFHQYLTSKRISLAERLLETADISVMEIAFRAGFSSGAAFSKAFRQAKGVTPSEYRRLRNQG